MWVTSSNKYLWVLLCAGSKPHFLDADPQLLMAVEGLSPNRSMHDVMVNFEAVSKRMIKVLHNLNNRVATTSTV